MRSFEGSTRSESSVLPQDERFLVADKTLQEKSAIKDLLNRLLDYRIIHLVGTALTHKSQGGTFTAYMIGHQGAYANLRKLANKFKGIHVTADGAKEQCRNAPVWKEQRRTASSHPPRKTLGRDLLLD